MSRHRDVRSMNYSDEYDGYDDVYGHSVEDDYCVSPGAEQFLFDRNRQQNISSFFTEPDIEEDNEEEAAAAAAETERYKKPQLSDLELAKLASCIEAVRNVIGDAIPEAQLTEKIIKSNYNAEIVLDAILKETPPKSSVESSGANKNRLATHAGFSAKSPGSLSIAKPSFAIPKLSFGAKKPDQSASSIKFGSLSALMANHAKSSPLKSAPASPSPRAEQSKKSFGTLADLTAFHLQKSNGGAADAPENFNVEGSPKRSFVIPKFTTARGNGASIAAPPSLALIPRDPAVFSLEKSISQVHVTQIQENKENANSDRETTEGDATPGRTTPDDLTIDLSAALRPSESKPRARSEKEAKKVAIHPVDPIFLGDICDIVPRADYAKFIEGLECKMSLSHLRDVRLTHSNRNLSPFGKMLCKRWRSRLPHVKRPKLLEQHHQQQRLHLHHTKRVEFFDFSTPSPDAIILAKLRRR